MKQKLVMFLCILVLISSGVTGHSAVVKASGDYTNPELTMTRVADINVYNDYIINNLSIDNTLMNNQDGGQVYKITLDHDGFISLLLAARNVTKTVEKFGTTATFTTTDATLTATVYRDSKLLYPIGPAISAVGTKKGESVKKIALDQGTYYIAIQTDKFTNSLSGSSLTRTYVKGTAEFIVYYQAVDSDEVYRPSNVGNENTVSIEKEAVGMLTATNPKDYYKFEINDKALVKINFMYGSANNAKFVLYSPEREELVTKTITGNSVWYNVEKYLEPGTYYCSLETVTPNDGGLTNLLINQTVYPLKLTQVNSIMNTYVKVSTIDNPKEIRYVVGRLTNSELTSSKWNSGKVITDELQFGVNKIGYYTVRVTDEYGNMFMQYYKVTSCDKLAPKRPMLKYYKTNSYYITGTAEKDATVMITVRRQVYTCVASSKGNFRLDLPFNLLKGEKIEAVAQDISGNVSYKVEVSVK